MILGRKRFALQWWQEISFAFLEESSHCGMVPTPNLAPERVRVRVQGGYSGKFRADW